MIFVRGARQLITLRGPTPRRGIDLSELSIIRDGSVLIGDDGLIEEVGSTRRIENLRKARGAFVVEAGGKVVMPGFVDSHTRPVFRAPMLDAFESRIAGGLSPDDEPSVESLEAALDARGLSPRALQTNLKKWFGNFVQSGTTTIDARCGLGVNAKLDLKSLRAVESMDGDPIEAFRTHSLALAESDVTAAKENLGRVLRSSGLASAFEVEHDPSQAAPEKTERLARLIAAKRARLRVICDRVERREGVRFALENRACTLEHAVFINDVDIDRLADSDAVAVLMPGATFHRGAGRLAPARRLVDRGAAVALATGFGPRFSPGLTMALVLSIACRQMRLLPEEAIAAATANGAAAIGCGHRLGSLEPGKQGDLAIFDVGDFREIPYYFGVNLCVLTMKKGRIVYRAGAGAPLKPVGGAEFMRGGATMREWT